MLHEISSPLTKEMVKNLKAGDTVRINGTVYAARDAAHKKMIELLNKGMELPFDVRGQIIYYVGPCPEREGQVIGSAGPTTSSRMDAYAPALIELGLLGMIGKGLRNDKVIEAMKTHSAVYLGAIGGAGALTANCIVGQEIIAFPELGPEALRKLQVKDFETVVIIDSYGTNLYEIGRKKYNRA
ncbi:MAG: Fe-S-containing hydro-lyase [Bacillota bacterium]|nr:Fe-S-containing hydro-lyase [Bacillota bacterium]